MHTNYNVHAKELFSTALKWIPKVGLHAVHSNWIPNNHACAPDLIEPELVLIPYNHGGDKTLRTVDLFSALL